MSIDKNIRLFVEGDGKNRGRKPQERYSSFDYCFNYFQTFRECGKTKNIASQENLQTSCLQLGFYLASWGMLRGSSFLLEKSVKFYEPLIQYIAQVKKEVWEIDVPTYTNENVAMLIDCRNDIRKALGIENDPSDTLVTKIMLGVFSNTPAFDTYVKSAFSLYYFDKPSLKKISDFYNVHKAEIDKHNIYTFDFATGKETHRKYTRAKLIDMVGFIEGQKE
jgi:hypothetical protein